MLIGEFGCKGTPRVSSPTSCWKQGYLWVQSRSLRTRSSLVLKTSKKGDCTAWAMSQGSDNNEWFLSLADISGRAGNWDLGNSVAKQQRGFCSRVFCSPSVINAGSLLPSQSLTPVTTGESFLPSQATPRTEPACQPAIGLRSVFAHMLASVWVEVSAVPGNNMGH